MDAIKLNAAQRLLALQIRQGDNFDDAKTNLRMLNGLPGSDFEILDDVGQYSFLGRLKNMSQWYVLTTKVDAAKLKTAKTLKAVTKIVGFITVLKFPNVDEIFTIYVDAGARGQGLGKMLYTLARKRAKKGLQSSDDLGVMSLATWLSLYKSNDKIFITVKGKKLPRKDVAVDGLDIKYKGQSLIGPDTPDFHFYWK